MQIEDAAKILKSGGVIGLPTETVWGLACALDSKEGVTKLMQMKDRGVESGKIFTLVPENTGKIAKYVKIPEEAKGLIDEYFPGPLTLILPKNSKFRHFYFDHFDSIGVRIPDFPLFDELLPLSGPLLLTSANRRGKKPAKMARGLAKAMPEVDLVINQRPGGQEPSTIVDFTKEVPQIIRRGALDLSGIL